MTPDILIVSADESANQLMQMEFKLEGYNVLVERDSRAGFSAARQYLPKLVILDEQAPGLPLLDLCNRLRTLSPALKIILITGDSQTRLNELQIDDFFLKPLRLAELQPRVALNLRQPAPQHANVLQFEDISLDLDSHEVYRGRRQLELTLTEFELLVCLLCHPQQVVNKDKLIERVWDPTFVGNHNLLHVYIRSLRNKLEAAGETRLIQTVRGVGYILKQPYATYGSLMGDTTETSSP